MCHAKTDLEIFVIVIPKEGLAGTSPANHSVGITLTVKFPLMKTRVQLHSWAGASLSLSLVWQ